MTGRAIGVPGVGCGVLVYDYLTIDCVEAPHGRAPAVASGIKRAQPDKIVFTYQGDGDIASIGMSEIIHAANRGEKITVIFVNNTVYGMTGGQMAPTTLLGQQTTTTPRGRNAANEGYPIRLAEMLAPLDGVAFCARVSLHDPKHVLQAKKVVNKAFQVQELMLGLGLVEILSACVTNWRVTPVDAQKLLAEKMIPCFPVGIIKDVTADEHR